jgi:hypothetical protein
MHRAPQRCRGARADTLILLLKREGRRHFEIDTCQMHDVLTRTSQRQLPIAACDENARSRFSSTPVNGPPRLFRTCVTAIVWPLRLTTGMHRIDSVL